MPTISSNKKKCLIVIYTSSLKLFFSVIKAFAFISTLTSELESLANSYKAKEYLLAEVSENPLFLLNFYPSNEYE